jgi:hypothetical protein
VLDTAIRLDCTGSGHEVLAEAVRGAWSRCLDETGARPDVRLSLALGSAAQLDAQPDVDLCAADVDLLLHRLSPLVTMRAIDHQAGRLVMLHAAGVADPATGRTVALVAPSGVGKTTAARSLCRRLGYVTDETMAVREDGSIATYPKPLSVIQTPGDHHKAQLSPDELGLVPAPTLCTLAGVLVLDRDGSASAWLEPVPLLTALARLGSESSYLSRLPRPLHRLAGVVERAGGLKVVHYADREQLLDLMDDMLLLAS